MFDESDPTDPVNCQIAEGSFIGRVENRFSARRHPIIDR